MIKALGVFILLSIFGRSFTRPWAVLVFGLSLMNTVSASEVQLDPLVTQPPVGQKSSFLSPLAQEVPPAKDDKSKDAKKKTPEEEKSQQNAKDKSKEPPAQAIKGHLSSLKTFDEVTKDADSRNGYFDLYLREEKVWLAIKPEQLEKPFFFSVNIPRSVGERGLYGSQMGSHFIAYFHRSGTRIQLLAKNEELLVPPNTAQSYFVEESYSESLLASTEIAAQPRLKDQALLIDASALLFTDIAGYTTNLDMAFRMGLSLDSKNSSFFSTQQTPELTALEVKAHFFTPKLSAPSASPGGVPGGPSSPPPPKNVPDPRSLFVHFYYNFKQLPATPMRARLADERVGYFTQGQFDYTTDLKPKSRVHIIKRWRLEKSDPKEANSPVVKPIVYWLDKNIPPQYKAAVTAGILEWNKAFEKIGLMGAVVVREQSEKESFNTMDAQHASVRWFTGSDIGFAIGPSQADPRTGEIIDADIGMSDVFAKSARRQVAEDMKALSMSQSQSLPQAFPNAYNAHYDSCQYMDQLASEFDFAQDLLSARGWPMGSEAAEKLAQAYVKDVIMHEVGHTLGLRHNFLSSAAYDLERLQDPSFTQKNGITSSVMDYTPFNFPLADQKPGELVMSTLGPYDYWAIEYGYKVLEPQEEEKALQEIASRSVQTELAFASDEDTSANQGSSDPFVNRFDLGANPLAYYKKRVVLSQELWRRLESLSLEKNESFERLSRSFLSGFRPLTQIAPLVVKYLGGERARRVRAGFGLSVYESVSAKDQREALGLIESAFFSPHAFEFSPKLLNSLAIDQFERASSRGEMGPQGGPISVLNTVLSLQKMILDPIFSDRLAQRVSESQLKNEGLLDRRAQADLLGLSEIYGRVQEAIWKEAIQGKRVPLLRRNLQKEHLQRLSLTLVRPSKGLPPEAAGLIRQNARKLLLQLQRASTSRGLDSDTKAHLVDSISILSESLKATIQRSGA